MTLPAAVLVLAAGYSRRFGEDKRQVPVPDAAGSERSVLERTVLNLAALGWPLTLVLRADDQPYAAALERNLGDRLVPDRLSWVYAQASKLGMGHSLAAGARALRRQGVERLLIALGDMPYLRPDTLTALAAAVLALDPARPGVVRPRYRGQAGHPVGLSGLALKELEQLTGDRGAQALLKRWSAATRWLDVDDPGVVQDIDHPGDLR